MGINFKKKTVTYKKETLMQYPYSDVKSIANRKRVRHSVGLLKPTPATVKRARTELKRRTK